MFKKLLVIGFVLALLAGIGGAAFVAWGYFYITRDLPQLSTIEDYRPPVVSTMFAADGTPIAEFFTERRYPAKLPEVPLYVRNAFLAAEDASFYSHAGIDPVSILRAFVKNLQAGSASQGGSTITQQVVKNLLLTPEKKITRKIKEAILSYQLERRFSKDEIFELYLNQIFFGNTAYGLKAAARVYFQKSLDQLTLAEGAMLAGLPKAPSKYSPLSNMPRAKRRQKYVLDQMVKAGFVTAEAAEAANREKIRVFPASFNNISRAPYYVAEARRLFLERWRDINIDADGVQIHTALDLNADRFLTIAVRRGLREVDKRRGWRGPLASIENADRTIFLERFGNALQSGFTPEVVYPALVTAVSRERKNVAVDLGGATATVDLREAAWAKKRLAKDDKVSWINLEDTLRVGDVIEVSLRDESNNAKKDEGAGPPTQLKDVFLDQTPDLEGAMVLLDPHSGKVTALVGGYSYGRSQFNRATQSLRQPGSTFKPVLYLAAVDGYQYTPSTIVHDAPRTFRVGDEYWTPANFDEKFLGAISLRIALEKSRNLVSADIVSRIGIDAVIQYAKRLGITSKLGRNLSLSLGSSEVSLLELTRAYGVFAAKGVLFDSVFITRVVDRTGRVLFDAESESLARAQQAIDPNSAFVMSHMMKGVIEFGTGYRIKEILRPVAGKTGTSNDQMDTWFIGYTPQWAAGVWVGFDAKKEIGDKETGGRVAAPIWLYAMREFLNYEDKRNYAQLVEEAKSEAARLGIEYVAPEPLTPLDFSPPEGVDPYWVNHDSGIRMEADQPGAFLEYFVRGTEPPKASGDSDTSSYLESPDL
jgi:penicillin-binding protein 1A